MIVLLLSGCGQADTWQYTKENETGSFTGISEDDPLRESQQPPPSEQEEGSREKASGSIFVQVCGAVQRPGVYEMPAGARVFEAIDRSGGLTEDAAIEAVNQAGVLEDGQMIYLPTEGEWEAQKGSLPESGSEPESAGEQKVNINTADATLLQTIPGIGKSRAESIIAYRQEHGAFSAIEDIKKVSGIKDGLFQKIKDKIRV